MATNEQVEKLKSIYEEFKNIDRRKLLRPYLGEKSLKTEFSPKLEEIIGNLEYAINVADELHVNHINNIVNILNKIIQRIKTHSDIEDPDYIRERNNFLNDIENEHENLKLRWDPVIVVKLQKSGLLEDEGIRKEYQKTVNDMQKKSDEIIENMEQKTKEILENAQDFANTIEEKARHTATGISVKSAQDQFREAQKAHLIQLIVWSVLSFLSILGFGYFAYLLAYKSTPPQESWNLIYFTTIRITILTAIGAVATFCLKILRAQLHMYNHNLHRQRVTNSIEAFVESAVTPEQRDFILARLVDAVVNFGSSGLIQKEDDAIYSSKMIIDNITKSIGSSNK